MVFDGWSLSFCSISIFQNTGNFTAAIKKSHNTINYNLSEQNQSEFESVF